MKIHDLHRTVGRSGMRPLGHTFSIPVCLCHSQVEDAVRVKTSLEDRRITHLRDADALLTQRVRTMQVQHSQVRSSWGPL
jgi:hypothetical protein